MDITQSQTRPRPRATPEALVDRKTCEADIKRALEAVGVEVDFDDLDNEDKANLATAQTTLVKAMQRGALTVDAESRFVFQTDPNPLVFRQPTGGTLMATDGKDGANVRRTFKGLSDLTGQPVSTFSLLPARDAKVCQAIFALFLG